MKEKRFTPRALILTAAVTLVLTLAAVVLTAWLRLGPGGLAVLQSMELINSRFPGDHDPAQTAGDAIWGMVDGLEDRWSFYMTQEEYEDWNRQKENVYVGVGLTYQANEDRTAMVIVSLVPGGPAEMAGLLVGESITAIDGQTLNDENMDALVATIGERAGKDITLTVLADDGSVRQVSLRSAKVESSSASGELLGGGIGYVRLDNFYQGSAASAQEVVEDLVGQGAKALLFDVRYNPGGYVSELTQLLDYLLPEGPVFAEHTKDGPVHTIHSDAACVDLPMAVLVNGDSYSAAELFAAQLRESVNASIIGQQTCGKGFYQQTFPLADGSALNLSTGLYTTGGGISLIGTGLTPDVVEEDPVVQMARAVECLTEKLG